MITQTARHKSCRTVTFAVIGLVLVGTLWKFAGHSLESSTRIISEGLHVDEPTQLDRPRYTNIALASGFGFHFDVYMTVAWTIQRLQEPVNLTVYTDLPFYHDFQTIIDDYGLYNGTYKHHDSLLDDVTENTGDGGIDMIIFGTCEIDMRNWGEKLLSAWDARDAEHKFQIVCIVHDVDDEAWQPNIPDWARRDAIRLLPISSHVKETYHQVLLDRARSADPALRSAGLEHIRIDVHVPILDVQNLPSLSSTRPLTNAVIQGSFSNDRRDYPRIFSELNQSLYENPSVWGYQPLGDSPSFSADTTVDDPPFQLHLVGSGWIEVPTELKNVVVIHTDLNYTDFYAVMGRMDVCVPAFLASSDKNYRKQASSSIVMCMEVNVPILAVNELRSAYHHIDDDRITITRPAVMSEVQALKALRTGDASAFLSSDLSGTGITLGSNPKVRQMVGRMMKDGWIRSKAGFDERKREVWRENEAVLRRILRDN